MTPGIERSAKICALTLLAAGAFWMRPHGQLHQPGQVPPFLAGLATMSAGYLVALRTPRFSAPVFWSAAIGLRLLLLTMQPGDDLYRYVWEGRVLADAWNPYVHAPDSDALVPLRDALWQQVGHRESTAIYPPLVEIVFALLAKARGGVLAFKSAFALADIAVCLLLVRRFGRADALLYAWNPLVLYVFAGGGHYDSLFLLPLVAAWLAWKKSARTAGVATLLGAAIAVKWFALPLLGWIVWDQWKRGARRVAALALACGATPLVAGWIAIGAWTGEWTAHLAPGDFVRYARSAELIPALLAACIPATQFLNGIFLFPIAVAWLFTIRRARTFEHAAEWMFFALFILSPLVHAWYFAWLLPFAVATRNAGSVALTISGLAYFWVHHRFQLPGETWRFTAMERAIIWLPFIAGFLRSMRTRAPRERPSASPRAGPKCLEEDQTDSAC